MLNLRKIKGSTKGNIGEIIFTSQKSRIHRTQGESPYYIEKLPVAINKKDKMFIIDNWNTFDAFELETDETNTVTNITFFEIKTMNNYTSKGINYGKKPLLTHQSAQFYKTAILKGYTVKSVHVVLYDNWNIDITTANFDSNHYTIWSGNPKFS